MPYTILVAEEDVSFENVNLNNGTGEITLMQRARVGGVAALAHEISFTDVQQAEMEAAAPTFAQTHGIALGQVTATSKNNGSFEAGMSFTFENQASGQLTITITQEGVITGLSHFGIRG